MHRFKFTPDDLFINRLKTYPQYNVFIYQGTGSVNKEIPNSGSGGLIVYDINRNITGSGDPRHVQPFVVSSSAKPVFKSHVYQPLVKNISGDYNFIRQYWNQLRGPNKIASYGSRQGSVPIQRVGLGEHGYTSSYGFSSPIQRKLTQRVANYMTDYFDLDTGQIITDQQYDYPEDVNVTASALNNAARKYTTLSDHFIFNSSSIRHRDLVTGSAGDDINFIFIPSMYYGSTIKKGSVELNYYLTGSKIASCADINHNGTLIQTTGSAAVVGSVVGLVMYDEGVIMLTSSINLETGPALGIEYDGSTAIRSSWQYFATTLNDGISHHTIGTASFDLNFKGTNYVNSMTMFAHARKGHLNHSNNPTYRDLTFTRSYTTSSGTTYLEGESPIANVVSASYMSASFEKTTYISKVHIYDEDGNLIAITSMAKPVKKTLSDEFTFKMKLDL